MTILSMFHEGDSFEGKEGITAIEAAATYKKDPPKKQVRPSYLAVI